MFFSGSAASGEFGTCRFQHVVISPNRGPRRSRKRIWIHLVQTIGFLVLLPDEFAVKRWQIGWILSVGDAQASFHKAGVAQTLCRIDRTHLIQEFAQFLVLHARKIGTDPFFDASEMFLDRRGPIWEARICRFPGKRLV